MAHAHPNPSAPVDKQNLFGWICTKNPFYAISAALVLWGLWVSFGTQTEESDTWLLMGGLASYTLLLAGAALLLVRYLNLWEDARTVLLLVVLMFLATSVTFDHVLVLEKERGTACYLIGLGIAIFVSELVLRGIRLRLPALYRMPYYLCLGLFFLYPIFVRQLLVPHDPVHEPFLWGLFGFSSVAGLIFLTLLPAVRRGASYVGDGPLPWPYYPWSLFFFLAIAVVGRSILMCWSMHRVHIVNFDRLIFGPYFLVPFGFALAVLLLEFGVVSSRRGLLRFCLVVPVLLLLLALVGHHPADPIYRVLRVMTTSIGKFRAFDPVRAEPDPFYAMFLSMFVDRLRCDPLFLTLALGVCYYAYAAARRVPLALEGLAGGLAAMAVVPTNALSEGLLLPPEPGPLLAPAALLLGLGFVRQSAWHLLFAAGCLSGVAALTLPLPETIPYLQAGVFLHLLVLAMLLLGVVFRDRTGLMIRSMGALLATLLAFFIMLDGVRMPEEFVPGLHVAYPLVVGILLALYGQLLRDSVSSVLATVVLGYWVFKFGWEAYRAVRHIFRGLDYIVTGLAFFAVALLVSFGKSGRLMLWIESRWSGLAAWLKPRRLRVLPVGPVQDIETPDLASSESLASEPPPDEERPQLPF